MADEALLARQHREVFNKCLRTVGELVSGIGAAITAYAKASDTLDRRAGNGVNTASVATRIAPAPRAEPAAAPTSVMLEPVNVTPVGASRVTPAVRTPHTPSAAAAAAAAAATLAAAEAVEAAEDAEGSSATVGVAPTQALTPAPAPAPTLAPRVTPGTGTKRSLGTDGEEEMTTSGKKKRIRKNWSAEEEERFMAVLLGEGSGLPDSELIKLLAVEFDGERTALQVSGHLKNLRNAKRI